MRKILTSILILLSITFTHSQCNIQASICQPGIAGPFNFVATGGPYAGGSFANAGCQTGANGIHNYGFITLNITQSGPLNLLINGNLTSGFIDVAVFNVPLGQDPCIAIQNGANAIGCAFAPQSSGCVQFGTAFPCGSSVAAPNVVAGQQIIIIAQSYGIVSGNPFNPTISPGSTTFNLQLGPLPGAQTGLPNSTINSSGPFCTTSSNTQLTAANGGGTWTGPGVSSTGVFNPSLAGVGTHTITYSLGTAPCNSTSTTQIVVNPTPVINIISTNVTCNGDCDGVIEVNLISGATYLFVGGQISGSGGLDPNILTGVCPGNYTVTVTQNGCSSIGNVVITEPPQLTIGIISHN
jgi:hypothetical protein